MRAVRRGKKSRERNRVRRREPKERPAGASEWVGDRVQGPFYVMEPAPYRPEMVLWLELPEELVVGHKLIDPTGPPVAFGETLREAMASPLAGPPRRPRRIRVADARLAAEVRAAAPSIEVVVAPTPEIDQFVRFMAESMPGGDDAGPSYFERGRIAAQAIEELFRSAELLFRLGPWKTAGDTQVLRMDVPALGVEGACVSIIGALGESVGLVIFPSYVAFERFLEAVEAMDPSAEGPLDMGTSTLSLNFERGADLPASMRREAAEHRWPVAGPNAYPWIQHRDADGTPRPLTEHDLRVVSACATALTAFFAKHRALFEREDGPFEPVCESYFDEHDLEVRFTLPYDASRLFEASDPLPGREPAHSARKVGRNAPCPCGSGKKYKKCCLGWDGAAREALPGPAALHELDHRLVGDMMRFAAQRFGDAWWWRASEDFDDHESAAQLFAPWAVYNVLVEGRPVVDWYREAYGRRLSETERAWLDAEQAAWLSTWEVGAVEPGRSLTLEDLLSGETRNVAEASGSKTLVRRDVILARVVDHEGISVLCGVHPRSLPPLEAARVVERIRGRLRRKRAVPLDRLRDAKIGRYMIARWEEAVAELDARRRIPPRVQNTDGEDLLLTVDHFDFDAARRAEIERRLGTMEGVDAPESDGDERSYVFTRPGNPMHRRWESTVVGRAFVSGGKLRLETNSVARADALRARVENGCGELIRYRTREHSDPLAGFDPDQEPIGGAREPPAGPPPGAEELMREMKARHYAEWVDQPVPALGDRTPRQAARTKAGRARVDLLLKDCENREARLPAEERFDFSALRRELGLEA